MSYGIKIMLHCLLVWLIHSLTLFYMWSTFCEMCRDDWLTASYSLLHHLHSALIIRLEIIQNILNIISECCDFFFFILNCRCRKSRMGISEFKKNLDYTTRAHHLSVRFEPNSCVTGTHIYAVSHSNPQPLFLVWLNTQLLSYFERVLSMPFLFSNLLVVAVGQNPVLLLGVEEQAEDVEIQSILLVGGSFIRADK